MIKKTVEQQKEIAGSLFKKGEECYDKGDYQGAVEWYEKAAAQGNAVAQYNLGVCYAKGEGVQQSYEKAVEWYTKAAEQGNIEAQNKLAECYEKGLGVEPSKKKAYYWRKRANNGGE